MIITYLYTVRWIDSENKAEKMPRIGLEPTYLAAPEPKSGVSTNFTIWADERS